MPVRAENDTKTKAPAPKRRKPAPATRREPDAGDLPTLGHIVRKILDGFPSGREFTLEDLDRDASVLVGRKVNSGTVSTCLSAAIRDGFPATKRRNGHGLPVTYRVEKPPPPEEEPRQDPSPATSLTPQPATSTTMAAAITIHVAIDRARLMDFLGSLGVHLVPGSIELGAIHLRSA